MNATPPVLLITVTGGRKYDSGILAAWSDGVLVWSDDQIHGGSPYHMARIDQAAISRTVAELSCEGPWIGERRYGPDARWTHITVGTISQPVIDVGSWHELFESDPQLVATANGIEPLGRRSRTEVLSRQPADYRRFRTRWEAVKHAALKLIPAKGTPTQAPDHEHNPW